MNRIIGVSLFSILMILSVVAAQNASSSDVYYHVDGILNVSKYTAFIKELFSGDVKANVDEKTVGDFCIRDKKWCIGDSFVSEWGYFSIVGSFTGVWILIITFIGWFTTGGHLLKHKKKLTADSSEWTGNSERFQWFWAKGTNNTLGFGEGNGHPVHNMFLLFKIINYFILIGLVWYLLFYKLLDETMKGHNWLSLGGMLVLGGILGYLFFKMEGYEGKSRFVWTLRSFVFLFAFAISFGLLIAIPFIGHILSAVTFMWAFSNDFIGIIFKSFGVLVPLVVVQLILFRKMTSYDEELRGTRFENPEFARSVDKEIQARLSPQGVSPEEEYSAEETFSKRTRSRRGAPPNVSLPGKRGKGRDWS